MNTGEIRSALGAVFSADNPQGYINNVSDGLFAIANALENIAKAIDALGDKKTLKK